MPSSGLSSPYTHVCTLPHRHKYTHIIENKIRASCNGIRFNSSTWEAQAELCGFETSLVSIASSRSFRVHSKTITKKNNLMYTI